MGADEVFRYGRVNSAASLGDAFRAIMKLPSSKEAWPFLSEGLDTNVKLRVEGGAFVEFDDLCRLLDSVGYEVVLIPTNAGGIVLDRSRPWQEFEGA
ncbi:hypothetical protein B7495_18145 (plasmid) [Cryobacterium sp. LW097]|nr:hypothetical protein B7495_18145 [Cryobacterium sp. LW097]